MREPRTPEGIGALKTIKRKDLTLWLQDPIEGGYDKSCFVGSQCLCGFLGP